MLVRFDPFKELKELERKIYNTLPAENAITYCME